MLTDLSRGAVVPGRRDAAREEAEASVRALINLQGQRQGTSMLEVRARGTPEPEYPAARTWASVMSTTDLMAQDVGTVFPTKMALCLGRHLNTICLALMRGTYQ